MMTVRQLNRLWNDNQHDQLIKLIVGHRCDLAPLARIDGNPCVAAAALAMIRLDEMNQSFAPLFSTLLHALIESQQSDGGWGDVAISALALRAVCLNHGSGAVVNAGVEYFAGIQQDAGSFPCVALRRMPGDAVTTALILAHLGDIPAFAGQCRVADAIAWTKSHESELGTEAQTLWKRAQAAATTYASRTTPIMPPKSLFNWIGPTGGVLAHE